MEALRIIGLSVAVVVFAVISYKLIRKDYVVSGCLFGLGAFLLGLLI